MNEEKVKEPKTIVYDYLFNYFGGDSFKDKIILGAGIRLAIRAYKDGEEIKFVENEEPKYKDIFYNENYNVLFDREKLFVIEKNLIVDNLFRIVKGWDKIEAEIDGYFLDYLSHLPEEVEKDLPEDLKGFPCSEPMDVSEEEFRTFLREHLNDFDISDNRRAQVPSVSFI